MDIGDLAILLLLVFPIIGRVLKGLKSKSKTPANAGSGANGQGAESESVFKRAIREIEAALNEAGESSSQNPPQEQLALEPRTVQKKSPRVMRQDQFHEQEPGGFESKGFTEFHEARPIDASTERFKAFEIVDRKKGGGNARIRKTLRNKKTARDSFIISEVFGKPHSLRRHSLRRHSLRHR